MKLMMIRSMAVALLLSGLIGQAFAHGTLIASMPGNGSEVSSPEALTLTFNEPVRLLRLTLVHGAAHEMDIGFEAVTTASAEFSFELPALMSGAHTVNWTIIGPDGHTVSDSFGFTVNPNASGAQMQQHSHGAEHHHH
ncbi:copper resistance protein CopC [Pseudohongiella sp. SYSU M77423]|uniref:copper resistance CopC family protein n=1 Tax=unclassified Pseudohongiella TaxID=2629611 RepID=UPI001F2867AB|nr:MULTISPECIES: copper resistance CopC family protein [unclassified Pseudohongiella]MDH7942273.1 copper resistance protein CopC [Pseudohongiella sp. SYSU M77423]MEC8859541.1 copper resistance CopC family protein [Pseudomonadota bacterium]